MYYREENGGIRVSGTGPVDLCSIFENGQCFRFEKEPDGSYSGVAVRRFLRVSAGSDSLFLYPCSKEDLAFADRFIAWNTIAHGIQRVDACRTGDGRLLLVELEDLNPYLSLLETDEATRRRFLRDFILAIQNT